jgi:Peptidase MA superfamily
MGRLTRAGLTLCLVAGLLAGSPSEVAAFGGFGPMAADATYGVEMTFQVQLQGTAPDRLELLLRIEGDETVQVAPVQPSGATARYRWDAKRRHVTPNTEIAYRWRATVGETVTLSPERRLLYDDDRPGLDWRSATIGEATVHWYGGAEAQARHFGDLTSGAVDRATDLLGHELAGPVDIFVYDSRDDFFGALGPGAREWTGAATYPELRTIFMWLQGGPSSYLDTTLTHEVTHVVFHDATLNPFHQPAHWFNEGLAVWSEEQSAGDERSTVEFEASHGGLFAFEAITAQFPIGDRGASLSYAEGTTMVGMIIDRYGSEAIGRIAAAYRGGASDDEALEAGTGVPADQLYADFYAAFGVDPPQPVAPAPIRPSNVRHPGGRGRSSVDGQSGGSAGPRSDAAPSAVDAGELVAIVLIVVLAGGLVATAVIIRRRTDPGGPPS